MGEDAQQQQLTHEIARTRDDLTRDVDALSDKVSPSRVVERRVQRTRYGLARMKDRVMGSAQQGTGAVAGTAQSVTGTAQSVAETASDAASSTAETVRERTEGNPLAAGLIAFGVGWLVSSLLPPTEREKRAAGAVVDVAKERGGPVAQEAASVGKEVGEKLKEKASEAAEEVKSTAQQGAQHVAEEGKSAASTVKEEVSSSSQPSSSQEPAAPWGTRPPGGP